MELKDIERSKSVLETKRGWGMFITFLTTMLPFVNMYAVKWLGKPVDAGMIALVGEFGTQAIEFVAQAIGVGLWVWGSFRPTSEKLTLLKQ